MSKLFYNALKRISYNNATGPSSSSASRGAINRDPKQTKAKRVGYQINKGGAGGGGRDNFEEHDIDLASIATAIRTDSYLTQGTMKFEELIFKSGWTLQSKNEQALEYLKYRLDMMAVATGITTEELFQEIARDIVWASNSFVAKARARNGIGLPPGQSLTPIPPSREPVVGYFPLPPQTVQVARDENGEVTRYQQEAEGGGDAVQFNPEDMIHIKANVDSGSAYGDPWLAPVIEDVRLLRKVEENASLLLYKHIFPILKYKVGLDKDGFEATDEEIEDVQSMLDGMTEDSMFVMPERHDVQAVDVNAIDGNPYLTYFENRVFSGMGLSQVDFGRGDTANRNTADAMTGQKADRVKGWQKVLETAINANMIEELLVEGGFDPLINPEFNVYFVFNEIELERKISKENHEIHKFNNNVQTWEETRANIGHEPVADESRLHYQMIGVFNNDAAEATTASQNQPQNQNGTRSAPKRKTEFINNESVVKESAFVNSLSKHLDITNKPLQTIYSYMRTEVLEQVTQKLKRNSSEKMDVSSLFSFNILERDRIGKVIEKEAKSIFALGATQAQEDLMMYGKPDSSIAFRTIREEIHLQNKRLEENIQRLIKKRIDRESTDSEIVAGISSIFDVLEFKLRSNTKSILARSYNYGYASALIKNNESYANVFYEGDCAACIEKNRNLIKLNELSSLDEVSIFYRIPPWHPNCECEVRKTKGGEM